MLTFESRLLLLHMSELFRPLECAIPVRDSLGIDTLFHFHDGLV